MNIYHYAIVSDSKLGFGNRLVFWVSGCPFRCKGCIVPHLQKENIGTNYSISEILDIIEQHAPYIQGITFSGGEPLLQAKELLTILQLLQADTMLFTGYNRKELSPMQLQCYNLFDLVVEGRFVISQKGNYLWRGSKNQTFASPTGKYKDIIPQLYNQPSAGLEIIIQNNKIWYYGIPTSNEIEQINTKLKKHINLLEH